VGRRGVQRIKGPQQKAKSAKVGPRPQVLPQSAKNAVGGSGHRGKKTPAFPRINSETQKKRKKKGETNDSRLRRRTVAGTTPGCLRPTSNTLPTWALSALPKTKRETGPRQLAAARKSFQRVSTGLLRQAKHGNQKQLICRKERGDQRAGTPNKQFAHQSPPPRKRSSRAGGTSPGGEPKKGPMRRTGNQGKELSHTRSLKRRGT